MPDVGRFFNIDVLAEDYDYQTPYAFSENKVIELEGLEAVAIGSGGVPVPVPPPTYGGRTTGLHPVGEGLWSKAKSNATNNWNGMVKHAGINYGIITTLAKVGLNLTERVLNSENDSKDDKKKTALENNKSKGKKAEKEFTEELKKSILRMIYYHRLQVSSKTVFDDVIVDGKTRKVKGTNETKSGDAKLTKQQNKYRNGETVELAGKKAEDANGQEININVHQTE